MIATGRSPSAAALINGSPVSGLAGLGIGVGADVGVGVGAAVVVSVDVVRVESAVVELLVVGFDSRPAALK